MAIALILLTTVFVFGVPVKTQKSPSRMPNYQRIGETTNPGSGRRLLVIAPHPDDESLGVGGKLAQSLAKGDAAKVVFMTNGDGYVRGLRRLSGYSYLWAADYLAYGETRQREALAAAKELGIHERDLLFLGFPDKGLATIWQSHWDANNPYVSRHTGRSAVPYQLAVITGAPYTAPVLLNILKNILSAYRPTEIYMPSTYDCHPDHWASGAFLLAALGETKILDSDGKPEIFSYYIHNKDQPQFTPHYFLDWGDKQQQYWLPTAYWAMKKRAIATYKTQTLIRPSMAEVYAQPEETLRSATIKKVLSAPSYFAGGVIKWPPAAQIAALSSNPDLKPVAKYKGLLKSAYILQDSDAIYLHLDTAERNSGAIFNIKLYLLSSPANDPVQRITLKVTPDNQQLEWVDIPPHYDPAWAKVTYGKEMIDISLLQILSRNAKYLMFNADTYSGHQILDRIPWSLLRLENP